MAERERFQLVVGLGEGEEGQRARAALDRAAAEAGKQVTVWARETLLNAVDEGPIDPIVEVKMEKGETALVNLGSVQAMKSGWNHKVEALISGAWKELTSPKPDEIVARWKRLHRTV